MLHPRESDERAYLDVILDKLRRSHQELEMQVERYDDQIQADKNYIWENKADLDGAEKATNRMAIHEMIATGHEAALAKNQLSRLIDSPYFGRIDFTAEGQDEANAIYIGIHTYFAKAGEKILIFDWRAPISSLFYDHEKGMAMYQAPSGPVMGKIDLKRQYRIRASQMEYMIESDLNIGDEVLQKELSQATSDKMKNIVVTIQKEQNAIIRNTSAGKLIVQGVAGSGKTSIALHRIAFLLYRFRGALTSDNIQILSPNKVFADYISNVLPELGEENIREKSLEELAGEHLPPTLKFQSFHEQVAQIIDSDDKDLIERIRYKASFQFVEDLDAFLAEVEQEFFTPHDLKVADVRVPADLIQEHYDRLRALPMEQRLRQIGDDMVRRAVTQSETDLSASQRQTVRQAVKAMFMAKSGLALYREFYRRGDRKAYWSPKRGQKLPYDDCFPLLYVHFYFHGFKPDKNIQHLLIDEMQDYTPIQYAVIRKLFDCDMTLLGDGNQSVNPYTSTDLAKIKRLFPDAKALELCKSYRSSYEITCFAQKISQNRKLMPVQRHGEKPGIYACADAAKQRNTLRALLQEFRQSEHPSLGILCKTEKAAKQWAQYLRQHDFPIHHLDFSSQTFSRGMVVTSVHMAKGLEFDAVIVPDVDAETYQTPLDRSLLYIACTRAMHRLDVLHTGVKSSFLAAEEETTDSRQEMLS